MPEDIQLPAFTKGWINRLEHAIGMDAFAVCSNVRVHHGLVEKIKGWEIIGSQDVVISGEIRHFFSFKLQNGTESTAIITETNIYSWTPLTTNADITGAAWAANNERVNAGQFGNLMLFTNNTRNIGKWSGSGNVADLSGLSGDSVTLAKTLEVNNEHVIIANVVISSTRDDKNLRWSDKNLPEIWTATASNLAGDLDFDEDPTAILRVKKMGVFNVVYKERSIWFLILVGLPFEYVKRLFTDAIGIISADAVIEVNGIHYFVTHDLDIDKFDGINLISLAEKRGIKEYIIVEADHNKLGEIHGGLDLELKEIYFTFDRRNTVTDAWKNKFDIVYNYEEDHFTIRDSISSAKGIYTRPLVDGTIDSLTLKIDDYADTKIGLLGVDGIPRFNVVMGDVDGKLYRYNFSGGFDGSDIDGFFESGDEDYGQFFRRRKIEIHTVSKQMQQIRVLADKLGTSYDVNFEVGVRDGLDKKINWGKIYTYKQDGSANGLVKTRAGGVYHRLRIGTTKKNQFWQIKGLIPRIGIGGRVLR